MFLPYIIQTTPFFDLVFLSDEKRDSSKTKNGSAKRYNESVIFWRCTTPIAVTPVLLLYALKYWAHATPVFICKYLLINILKRKKQAETSFGGLP